MATEVYTTNNAINAECIQKCRCVQVDHAGWAKVQVGANYRFVPTGSWAQSEAEARQQLRNRVATRLAALKAETEKLKALINGIDDFPVVQSRVNVRNGSMHDTLTDLL